MATRISKGNPPASLQLLMDSGWRAFQSMFAEAGYEIYEHLELGSCRDKYWRFEDEGDTDGRRFLLLA